MSFSISAYGIAIDDILGSFGSKSQDIVDKYANLDKEEASILKRAVMEGVPFPELDEEMYEHVYLMKYLFENAPDSTWGDCCYGYSWLYQLTKDDSFNKLDQTTKQLIHFLTDGRPIFGKRFCIDIEPYYCYLNAEEVKLFNKALSNYKLPEEDSPEWDDYPIELLDAPHSELTSTLAELLPQVVENKQGLAIYMG